jgi:regulator of protease activity HflC (stomatin/prohibitin superfamily)
MKRRIIATFVGFCFVLIGVAGVIIWATCRIYVPQDMCAVLIRKTGKSLPAGAQVAPGPGFKGIQEQVLGPGRHWRNPYSWDWELHPLINVPSGDATTWEWDHLFDDLHSDLVRGEPIKLRGRVPMVGVVERKIGQTPPDGRVTVRRDSSYKGVWEEVLTPGIYKLNPLVYNVELTPAVVIPSGFVGVVTNLFDDHDVAASIPAPEPPAPQRSPGAVEAAGEVYLSKVPPLSEAGRRGTVRDVLQPGIYYINPKIRKVTIVEIGYNEFSQLHMNESENMRISFPSDTGYLIRVGVTVVWGIHPKHAADIINEFGNIDRVISIIIEPQLRSICRNIGSTYAARDFIQGEKREQFQRELTDELRRVCNTKHVDVLLALVLEIEVHAPSANPDSAEVTEDLKRTIQQSYVAIERQITNERQREAAAVVATLEEEKKKIDIVRETIVAETRLKVADIAADADKQAAEIEARAQLEVATIRQKVAELEAKRTEILGRARTSVDKMLKQAEADGYAILVDAFGSPHAYNLYTFAEGFEPEDIRLFFAGEGTFWTDLTRFEEIGGAKLMQQGEKR